MAHRDFRGRLARRNVRQVFQIPRSEILENATGEIRDLIAEFGFVNTPIVPQESEQGQRLVIFLQLFDGSITLDEAQARLAADGLPHIE
jgi:hypothetical protein